MVPVPVRDEELQEIHVEIIPISGEISIAPPELGHEPVHHPLPRPVIEIHIQVALAREYDNRHAPLLGVGAVLIVPFGEDPGELLRRYAPGVRLDFPEILVTAPVGRLPVVTHVTGMQAGRVRVAGHAGLLTVGVVPEILRHLELAVLEILAASSDIKRAEAGVPPEVQPVEKRELPESCGILYVVLPEVHLPGVPERLEAGEIPDAFLCSHYLPDREGLLIGHLAVPVRVSELQHRELEGPLGEGHHIGPRRGRKGLLGDGYGGAPEMTGGFRDEDRAGPRVGRIVVREGDDVAVLDGEALGGDIDQLTARDVRLAGDLQEGAAPLPSFQGDGLRRDAEEVARCPDGILTGLPAVRECHRSLAGGPRSVREGHRDGPLSSSAVEG